MQKHLTPASETEQGRNRLGTCLIGVIASQKGYGSQFDKEALMARKSVFMAILGDYPPKAIEDAFHEYCADFNDLPAPADIKALLDKNVRLKKYRRIYKRLNKLMEN